MLKKYRLYSLISLFVIGGLYVPTAHATDFTIPPVIPAPFTDFIASCENGGTDIHGNCTVFQVAFFNDMSSFHYSGANHVIGSGDIITDDTQSHNIVAEGHLIFWNNFQGIDYYSNCPSFISGCTTFNPNTAGVAAVTNGTSTNQDASKWIYSTRNIRDENGNLLYTANTPPSGNDVTTRIISFTPEEGTTTQNPVNFSLHAYINPADVGAIFKIRIEFQNIDQNVFLAGIASPSQFEIFFGNATTTGDWYFATTTSIGEGNYRVNVNMVSCASAFGVCITGVPFYGVNIDESHQFVVGHETFIGHISQQSFKQVNDIFASTSATSTAALAVTCNPLGGSFSISNCLAYMFVPDSGQLIDSLNSFKNGFLIRVPWGYLTRFVQIVSSPATTTLPSISYTFDSNSPLHGATWNIDTNAMIAGGGDVLDAIQNVDSGRTLKDVFYPLVQLLVAIAVVFQIVHDLTGSHSHDNGQQTKQRNQ